jgi:UDP-N-acetylglucosamine--N-acetylmuramyl-(pentapeptide) pyrophosphoryl-undecaprenol N-acetylglucosamine transferase
VAFPSRFRRSIDDVRSIIEERGVDVVVGFGGYVATPAYLAARRADVPVAIHEATRSPGSRTGSARGGPPASASRSAARP